MAQADNKCLQMLNKSTLYITSGSKSGWAGAADAGQYTNQTDAQRRFTIKASGNYRDEPTYEISMENGKQLYANSSGWVAVAEEGKEGNDDKDRRTWVAKADGEFFTFSLRDGRQLYISGGSNGGWAGVARENECTNNDLARRQFRLYDA